MNLLVSMDQYFLLYVEDAVVFIWIDSSQFIFILRLNFGGCFDALGDADTSKLC